MQNSKKDFVNYGVEKIYLRLVINKTKTNYIYRLFKEGLRPKGT